MHQVLGFRALFNGWGATYPVINFILIGRQRPYRITYPLNVNLVIVIEVRTAHLILAQINDIAFFDLKNRSQHL